ncbi:hypothetical protein EDF42_3715 [Curtobacterium sp. PhB172]|uniref:hypothetical protein n=1 Tax=Curtobacterium sp. PhB170 TaxID=2485194 RepID=UPI000FB7EF66|nr:hypothetical protein [Curtobacterium sp. PhB170]ROQ04769.1 hypothetical protein EDF41_3420 [Curtobacterium sp. PhB171]ROS33186.1 hypothetical protein EDF25_3244 [Curtobacterium sp. PhB131]ROS58467.1 hypothetical protein EDF42_3715 [Curtobacterium sp. PhB172]ROS72422.1 hypothetical protein EDF30_0347 [Curtobacterium sp. PhB141]ROQ28281.1 hypothetical protein EDF40_1416 [Curtobacterium sp. PhB170]
MTEQLPIKRAARLLQRSGDPAYAKYTVALRVATARASTDPEWAPQLVQLHLADRDNARDAGRDPGRFGTPLSAS